MTPLSLWATVRARLASTPAVYLAATLPFLGWAGYAQVVGGALRWELLGLMLLVPALAVWSPSTRRLFSALYGLGLGGLAYELNRLVATAGISPSRVHLCDLRALEARYLGFDLGGARVTVHDWFQAHASLWLDALCAVPYGTHIFATIAYGLFLYRRDPGALRRLSWAFLVVNVAGLVTHHAWPAAAPWYYHAHGCVVDVTTRTSPGPNLLRVDALLGVDYFKGLYGRSHDVFGAMPSLHVSYPLLMVLEGWPLVSRLGRALVVGFLVWMGFAAVYLDHHWVIDLVGGIAYGLGAWAAVRGAERALARPGPSLPALEGSSR